ncbi:putative disease resistance protein RGA4 [Zingiber officinale]|uniref:putative disease resistance protein RGA4 n=1 Tax=Zingiber officinale TaxID=94328 RepID=UPI001C4D1C51|nr:putative disease resistance protein RGA4 [Zingiber officinale]
MAMDADLATYAVGFKELVGIQGRMEKLKELSTIIDMVIQDVEACSVTVTDAAVKNLLRKLKHLAYEVEDVVDYYDTKALRKQRSRAYSRPVRDFFSSNNNQLVFKSKISGMIKAVTENLDSILLEKSILKILSQGSNPSAYGEIHAHNSLAVIGRETEKEMIVNMLTDDEGSSSGTLKVIAIVGMGGLGKTALARHVFNDKRVKDHFNTYWKVVGKIFKPTEIMKSILELAVDAKVDISEPELVRGRLETVLSRKRFLLVLDDVWNEDALLWRELKAALSCGARGSTVLVTTRSQKVSSIMGSFKTHQIQQLSRDDCLSLFREFAFGDAEPNENLMEIGEKIVEKCAGVPLAAVSLGSALHSIRDETYWSSVLNSEVWQLRDEDQKFLAVLKLSYDALPPWSKKCFAFAALFPKKYAMKKDDLIQMWAANGFVSSEGNFDAETVGNSIFDDLVLRSCFLPSKKCDDGRHVTESTMHDLMHDLTRSISKDQYYNSKDCQPKDIQKRTYHLCIEDAKFSNTCLLKKPLYLRTLLLRKCHLYDKVHLRQFVLSKLKFLRVLDLSENFIEEVPTSVENLIHLRYLNLSRNKIKVQPDAITRLQNLRYLNLTENPLQELPKKLRNMQSLCYLHCDCDYLTHMPPGLSRLTNLRSLSCFVAGNRTGSCSIIELEDLKLHGQMEIKFSGNFTNYSCGGRKILKNKDFNELSLLFNCSDTNDMSMLEDLCPNTSLKKLKVSNYGSQQFPTWLIESQLPNLVEVVLEKCYKCQHIPHFGDLQFLRSLVIDTMHEVRHIGVELHGHCGFPSLQELKLIRISNLEEWSEDEGGVNELFPLLKRLEICNCPKLKNMPRLPRIELLNLRNCNESLVSGFGRMTSLSHLILEDMEGMRSLPIGCLRNLTFLKELEIRRCNELESLPMDELQLLTMVHSLSIEECNNLASFPLEVERVSSLRYLCFKNVDSNALQSEILVEILNSLNEFDIQICGKKVNLGGQLQHLHTLRQLWISDSHHFSYDMKISGSIQANLSICCCDELESLMTEAPSTSVLEDLHICDIPNLKTLPEWLQHLGSLHQLSIRNCPQLESLPRSLQGLRLLNSLLIDECSLQLERRCKRETGEDWPSISHVPHIDISTRVIYETQCCGPFFRVDRTRSREV